MGTVKDRLKQYIDYLGISTAEFERTSQIGNGSISKPTTQMRSSTLRLISNAYPELNLDWVRTGRGEMIKDTLSRSIHHVSGDATLGNKSPIFKNCKEVEIKTLEEGYNTRQDYKNNSSHFELHTEIARLTALLKNKDNEIIRLNGRIEEQEIIIDKLLSKNKYVQ